MPIKGLSEQRRLPRVGKLHLGIKKMNKAGVEYPVATNYFVIPEKEDAPGYDHREELVKLYGEKPKELRIVFPLEDEEAIVSQYYRYYTRTHGLVCRGDGEQCARLLDIKTGDVPTPETVGTQMKEMPCAGRDCPDYQASRCREMMHLIFMLPEVSGLGVWQIDTSSINSIRTINSNLELLKAVYGRVSMVPLILSLKKMQVVPPGGKKKSVYVLDITHPDSMIAALIKARKPPLELITGPPDIEQAEKNIEAYWPAQEREVMLSPEEAATRMTPTEIEEASAGKEEISSETEGDEKVGEQVEPAPTVEGAGFKIDMDWLGQTLKAIKWDEETAKTWIANILKVDAQGKLSEVLALLTREQAERFTRELNERANRMQPELF